MTFKVPTGPPWLGPSEQVVIFPIMGSRIIQAPEAGSPCPSRSSAATLPKRQGRSSPPPRPPALQRPGGEAGCSQESETKLSPPHIALIRGALRKARALVSASPCRSPSLEKGFHYTSESIGSGLKSDPDGLSCIWVLFFVGPKVADLRNAGCLGLLK